MIDPLEIELVMGGHLSTGVDDYWIVLEAPSLQDAVVIEVVTRRPTRTYAVAAAGPGRWSLFDRECPSVQIGTVTQVPGGWQARPPVPWAAPMCQSQTFAEACISVTTAAASHD